MGGSIPESVWAGIEAEFTLPSLDQVRSRITSSVADPEPVMRELVRVFIGEGTFCPGFQFLRNGGLNPAVTDLFKRALDLKIPHNYFAAWMVTASTDLDGGRPVDLINDAGGLLAALEVFARR
ncbi:hypothetical protein Achl_4178 (plasmid) [Pseudarthrobacter chlorophenolicus A6]|uniref:Antitoxin Xre/MbcA/ParS-like toxin-binding domain-containing protein n=1 Tax=Pseudarthrobacter chlorophenolicus (strain ATCC 700700 / DSM 12829 / CIP 107037 / JCM 12360 / KCTC 9906 / NCIMB 13794 / A6) TaxID=452863 RepID=B8HI82_PSECP|nr:hypothetical protein [Pseudarthrobacter chlorophenolicus]ACL42129.1 hypothetical protein Achl_4178 [Pseudarthrobacter chlorophenolicus A6]SDQ13815.1 hypothetical protein SAMN04489738_0237 [Pseudarthrobacter chlorophenolicus]